MTERFRAILLTQADGRTHAGLTDLHDDDLMPGNVVIDVQCSTLNYKDALAITGSGPIIRNFPFIPGIDLAGVVRQSADQRYHEGQAVLLTGWGVGERHFGGLAERARVQADWLVPMPAGMDARTAMTIGTAGFTAALCVRELERQDVKPGHGDVLVTGASGGVGCIAVALLAAAGFRVVASTGKASEVPWLKDLGAAEVIDRAAISSGKGPLDKARFAGAIDTVGGTTLANVLKTIQPGGTVAAVGNAGGPDLVTTVFPFILRSVRLSGVDSVQVPFEPRLATWQRLATDLPPARLAAIARFIGLADVPAAAADLLAGNVRGRVVVDTHQ